MTKLSFLITTALLAQNAIASGYHFGTQSVGSQSTANSAAAEAADASTIFYNPAGLTKLDGRGEFTIAGNLVFPSIKYSEAKAEYRYGQPVTRGSDHGKITELTIAPHAYAAYKLNDRVSVGLGMYIPFGSKTEYDKDSVLRYNINKLGLTTIAFEPVVAFKANDKHSFGVGLIGQYSQAELRKFSDWNVSKRFDVGRPIPLPVGSVDGYAEVKGHDWGFGYHLGWMYDVNDRLRVGANYRSKVEHNLKGTAHWHPSSAISQAAFPMISSLGYRATEDASVKIVTPESLSVHGMYKANNKLNLFGDVTWTRHSRFKTADLVFENPKSIGGGKTSNTTTITPNWRNTYKVAVGASYQYSEPLQLRAGIAFDQSPVKSSADRMNTMPDANRLWFSAGARYTHKQRHVFDVAYSYIHINNSDYVASTSTGNDVDSRGKSSAHFQSRASLLGMQYTYKF